MLADSSRKGAAGFNLLIVLNKSSGCSASRCHYVVHITNVKSSHVKGENISMITSSGAKYMDYALAYHQSWEVFLHERLSEALSKSETVPQKKQDEWIAMFMQKYPHHYDAPRICSVCQKAIADALAAGEDPFKPTPLFRRALEEFGKNIEKKWRRR